MEETPGEKETRETVNYVKRGLLLFFCIQMFIGIGAIYQMYLGQQLMKLEFNNLKEQVTDLKQEIKDLRK